MRITTYQMNKMDIPEELQISVYHEGVGLLLAYSSHKSTLEKIATTKKSGDLIREITSMSDEELQTKYELEALSVQNTSAWSKFLKQLQYACKKYDEFHPIVLGSVIEIMDELNWQERVNIRKLLTFFLGSQEEMAHLRLAISGGPRQHLLTWREGVIEEAKGYAAYKSKIA